MDASSSPIGLIIFFILLLLGGAYFACAETALSAAGRIRVLSLADKGDRRAARVLALMNQFDKTIATILIGSNLMQIGCATLAAVLATRYWGESAVGVAAVITTILVFLLAEMIPKSYAKSNPERIAMRLAPGLALLVRLLSPFSHIFSAMGRMAKKPLRGAAQEVTATEEELHDIIETIAREGALEEKEAELVHSALEFTQTSAREVFTPWRELVCIQSDSKPPQIAEIILSCRHSRLPVVDAGGNAVGVLQIRKYLKFYLERKGQVSLKRTMDKPYFAQSDTPIDELLAGMSARKMHVAILIGEAGAQLGIVTVEDILEELVGEIYDEDDTGAPV